MRFATTILLCVNTLITCVTLVLIFLPISRQELKLWRGLRINKARRHMTKRRKLDQPFDRDETPRLAWKNLHWHLILTTLFTYQVGTIVWTGSRILQPAAFLLTIFCVAYLVGSLVQRQKVAIIALSAKVH